MVMGLFPKEMLEKQLNFAICTYKKSQDSFPSMTKMAKHRSYHYTFHNLSLHVLSLSLHSKIKYGITTTKRRTIEFAPHSYLNENANSR